LQITTENVVIEGNLQITHLSAKNLHINKLNNVSWTPKKWLSFSTPQNIIGNFKIEELEVEHINISEKSIFKGI